MNVHYCGGKFKSVSLPKSNTKSCCGDEMETKGCCHNEMLSFKLKEKQEPSHFLKISKFKTIGKCDQTSYSPRNVFHQIIKKEVVVDNYHAPPNVYKNPLFILNRVLII